MKIKTFSYALMITMVFPVVLFSEESQTPVTLSGETTNENTAPLPADILVTPEAVPVTNEVISDVVLPPEVPAAINPSDKIAAEKREETIKQYAEGLIYRILEGDTDTGEMPEAGFSVNLKNENLEKLLALGEPAKKYIYSLLKGARSGHIKERIVREISEGSAELDELTTETLFAVIKDKSSQVRLLTAKILGERGSSKTIARLNSLLYDPYSLRKDVNPVRLAAREAIELIKLREEAMLLPAEDRAKKWIQVIKDKAAARQDYFCEKAAKEFYAISLAQEGAAAKEDLFKEVIAARDVQGKKTLVNNKIFGYLLLSSAIMKDERALPLIENAFKDVSLMNLAARAVNAVSFEAALEMLLSESPGSEKAAVLFNNLKKYLLQNKVPELTVRYPEAGEEEFNEYARIAKEILLVQRDNKAYMEAAKIFYYGLNDYPRALEHLAVYEKKINPVETPFEEEYFEILAGCLAAEGNIKKARETAPIMNLQQYIFNLQLLELLSLKEARKKTFRTGYYTANAFMEMKAYSKAAGALKELMKLADENPEITRDTLQAKINYCEAMRKDRINEIYSSPKEAPENLKLEIFADRQEYRAGEEIKINFIFKNTGTEPVYGANDKEGNLGFDLVVMKKGLVVKRLKNNLAKQSEIAALEANLFTIEPGSALSSEIIALSPAENDLEAEFVLQVSYAPSTALFGYEKGWIEQPVLSNDLKIRIKK